MLWPVKTLSSKRHVATPPTTLLPQAEFDAMRTVRCDGGGQTTGSPGQRGSCFEEVPYTAMNGWDQNGGVWEMTLVH